MPGLHSGPGACPSCWPRPLPNVPPQADAAFIAGNGLRAVGMIDALEESLRRPVLTANQVLLWRALQGVGAAARVTQYGRIFRVGAGRLDAARRSGRVPL